MSRRRSSGSSSGRGSISGRQQRMVRQLMNFVTVSEREAIEMLRQADWSVQAAAEKFLTESRAAAVDTDAVDNWFDSYNPEAGPEGHSGMDAIDAEAVMQFCSDIGVDAESDVIVLAIAWKMDAEVMGTFSRKEFQKGMAALGAESADALREKLPALRAEIADPFSFKKMYSFCFKFARDPEVHTKNLSVDVASAYWNLLLSEKFENMELWTEFIESKSSSGEVKFISKDQWSQLLQFALTIEKDLSNFDEDEAWPVLIDDFVVWVREQRNGVESKQ